MEPQRITFNGRADEPLAETVKIIPQTNDPLTISDVSATRGVDFAFSLEEIELAGKKAFGLHVENTRTEPGRYYDTVRLKTDSDIAETISIIITGIIRPPEPQSE